MKSLGLKARLVIWINSAVFAVLALLVFLQVRDSTAMARNQAFTSARDLAQRYAQETATQLEHALRSAQTIAETLAGFKADWVDDRALYNSVLKQQLAANPQFAAVWSAWEPNALDGKDTEFANRGTDQSGRFMPLWFRGSDQLLAATHLTALASSGEPFFAEALRHTRPVVSPPFATTLGERTEELISISVPIRFEGAMVGVAGVMLPVSTFQQRIASIQPYGTGSAALHLADGRCIAHRDPALVGRSDAGSELLERARNSFRLGQTTHGETTTRSGAHGEVYEAVAAVHLGDGQEPWLLVISLPLGTILAEAHAAMVRALILSAAALLVIGGIVQALAGRIARPLREAAAVMHDVAARDLTVNVAVRGTDEVAQIGQAINAVVHDLGANLRSVASNSQSLTGASEQLSAVSTQMHGDAQATSAQAGAVSSAAEQVSKSVATVATASEEMTTSIREIASQAGDAARFAAQAVVVAEKTNTTIVELGSSSTEIGNVVKVITSIADQTNLLALNATIEAARAGEAGRGFAVVANEVKELARQTAQATNDIRGRIESIQVRTRGAVEAIRQITEVIQRINEIQTVIASSVEEQAATMNEISQNSVEASRGSADIANSIAGVSAAATRSSEAARRTATSAADLSVLAVKLNDIVALFRLDAGSTNTAGGNGDPELRPLVPNPRPASGLPRHQPATTAKPSHARRATPAAT